MPVPEGVRPHRPRAGAWAAGQLPVPVQRPVRQGPAILAHFISGADPSAGGILHAVTSVAQTLPDADVAHDLEATAITATHLAASA